MKICSEILVSSCEKNKRNRRKKQTNQKKERNTKNNLFCLQVENYHPNLKNLIWINLVIQFLVLLKLNNQMKQQLLVILTLSVESQDILSKYFKQPLIYWYPRSYSHALIYSLDLQRQLRLTLLNKENPQPASLANAYASVQDLAGFICNIAPSFVMGLPIHLFSQEIYTLNPLELSQQATQAVSKLQRWVEVSASFEQICCGTEGCPDTAKGSWCGMLCPAPSKPTMVHPPFQVWNHWLYFADPCRCAALHSA